MSGVNPTGWFRNAAKNAAWSAATTAALASCHAPQPKIQPFGLTVPAHAPYHARTSNRFVLKLYSGSEAGLIVGGGPLDGNPGLQLTDLSFAENPGLARTYVWAFTPGIKLLDHDCHPITQADAVALANTPGANSVIVIDYLGADGRPVAPAKLQFWARASGGVADCQGEETS